GNTCRRPKLRRHHENRPNFLTPRAAPALYPVFVRCRDRALERSLPSPHDRDSTMARRSRVLLLIGLVILALVGGSTIALLRSTDLRDSPFGSNLGDDTYTIEVTDYAPPKDDDIPLADDRLEDKKTAFDPSLVDRRPIEQWSLTGSEAVIRLDVPIIKP